MGYALFANRKIMYSNMIFYLQMQLNQLVQERMNNMIFTSNISDGCLTPQEMFEDPANTGYYEDYRVNVANYVTDEINDKSRLFITPQEYYGVTDSGNLTPDQLESYDIYIENLLEQEYAKRLCEKFEVEDQRLEQKIKQLETKITVMQKDLEKVEEQEGKAIEAATPKYGGVA